MSYFINDIKNCLVGYIIGYIYRLLYFMLYVIQYFFSYSCVVCRKGILYSDGFCASCWANLDILDSNICDRCGKKLSVYCCQNNVTDLNKLHGVRVVNRGIDFKSDMNIKGEVADREVLFRYALKMNKFAKVLLYRFKYYDEYVIGRIFARLLLKYIKNGNYDYVIPISMFYLKKIFRLYDSAYIIAYYLQQYSKNDIVILNDLLYKKTYTAAQKNLNFKQRQVNVKGSFAVFEGHRIANKKIILVDDLYTTGATMKENLKLLLPFNPMRVMCLSIFYN